VLQNVLVTSSMAASVSVGIMKIKKYLHKRQEVKTNFAQTARSQNKLCRNGNLSGRGIGARTKNNGL
jgi:hypothetical protein